jgi:DNA-binding transcriptional LysR family regulator
VTVIELVTTVSWLIPARLRASAVVVRPGPRRIALPGTTRAAAAAAIASGLGVGYLPCMLGDRDPNLVRVGGIEPALDDELWLLTHPDIRKSDRIRAFMRHCIEALARDRGLIEGLCPRRPDTIAQAPARVPSRPRAARQ